MSIRAVDIAYDCLQEKKDGMTFSDLWKVVKDSLGYGDTIAGKKISQFYTNLSLDGRFISLENNVWNLKSHCKYDELEISKYNDAENKGDEQEDGEDNEGEENLFIDEETEDLINTDFDE